jgi:hypothetical protein
LSCCAIFLHAVASVNSYDDERPYFLFLIPSLKSIKQLECRKILPVIEEEYRKINVWLLIISGRKDNIYLDFPAE